MKENINFCYMKNSCLYHLATHNTMKTDGKAEEHLKAFLTSTPDLSSGQLHPSVLKPPNFPSERKLGGHLGQSKHGSGDKKSLQRLEIELRFFGHPRYNVDIILIELRRLKFWCW